MIQLALSGEIGSPGHCRLGTRGCKEQKVVTSGKQKRFKGYELLFVSIFCHYRQFIP